MKILIKSYSKRFFLALLVLIISISCVDNKKETASYSSGNDEICKNISEWFPHQDTPAPIEEGDSSVFSLPISKNSFFHRWSWHKFLWLTKPASETDQTPLFLQRNSSVLQIDKYMTPIPDQLLKGTRVYLTDTIQAGFAHGVLRTNPTYVSEQNKKSYTVHYSIHMNTTMFNAALSFKDSIIKQMKGFDVSKVAFPVGSFELKVSWVNAKAINKEKLKNYYVTKGVLNGNIEDVAMLGMHVVGIVENHPEFIWATFEHDDIAPNYDWPNNNAQATTEKLLFRKGKTTGLGGITFENNKADSLFRVFDLFTYGVPRNSDGLYQNTSQEEPLNFKNIDSINTCVREELYKEKSVWANYFYNGSIWIDTDKKTPAQQIRIIDSLAGNIDSATKNSFARGSLNAANVTMETFTQTFESTIEEIAVTNLVNCFTCHNSSGNGANSPLYLSHVFNDFLGKTKGRTPTEIEQVKAKREVLEYLAKKKKE